MSGVSFPVTRAGGCVLVVGSASSRTQAAAVLAQLGLVCRDADDPYAAALEICSRPLAYAAVVVSLAGLYHEELAFIGVIKRRFPHIEVWLAHIEGRHADLAEAMRLGADGLLAEDGLHRTGVGAPASVPVEKPAGTGPAPAPPEQPVESHAPATSEPVLTADELRALLHEQPGEEAERT
jgi:hypothetical protein